MTEAELQVRETRNRTYMTIEEVADLCRVAMETVRYWRQIGVGPKSFRLPGSRRVLYAPEDVDAWISEARGGDAA
jgi:DNA-binding transcriptional MerR regulator